MDFDSEDRKMEHSTEIQLQGDMGEAVEIEVRECPEGWPFTEQDGSTKVQARLQDGSSDLTMVIVAPNPEREGGPEYDNADRARIPSHITSNCTDSTSLFDVALSDRFGYVYSLDRAEKVRRDYEMRTNTSYVAVSNVKLNFGQTELSRENHRIYWEEPQQDTPLKSPSKINFDGVPFILLAKRVLDCQHGRDWRRRSKEKTERKRRKKPCGQETRKLGCLATIIMRELVCFPEFEIDENSEYKRKLTSKRLRVALKEGEVKGQKRIYVDLPEVSSHNHPVDQDTRVTHQALDERVLKKLQELVGGGVLGVEEMRLHLQNYVKNEICFGQPSIPLTNRRFFPSKFTIRTHIRRCCAPKKHLQQEENQVGRQLLLPAVTMAMDQIDLPQAQNIGQAFCTQYYNTFDMDRKLLAPLFTDVSIMSFEGDVKVGVNDIIQKLTALPFRTVKHVATSIDSQPTLDQSILVSVLGQVKTDEDPPKAFHQSFLLKSMNGTFYVLNDIFRLGLHNF
ncbi:uncharacterized protein LOC110988256 [Acanthaster planci]|uniref:Uncharacterized protein LOC110988256 n=1 Tax=Acanthaster planci TaxID=133434 RepID=A0A8B7ZNX2_ACAPL|nr:uncharacterized protein LOC110988256 [Acanthaster planci]